MAMGSRPLLLLGNVVAIVVTIVAFVQAISWPVAGVLILVSLVLPLLANISPPRGAVTSHLSPKIPATTHHSQTQAKISKNRTAEKHSPPSHSSSAKIEQRTPAKPEPARILGPKTSPRLTAPTVSTLRPGLPRVAPTPIPMPVKQGPNFNPTIPKGDYTEYDVELDAGKDFSGEVTATGLVNVYLLDEDNLDNLDQGEEFWSETGEESVEKATLEFTATSKGKWFFVVENADDRAISVAVKIQKEPASVAPSQ
jgi:hypothetical protein